MNKPKIHINSEKNIALKTRTHSPTSNSPNASNRSKICPIGAEKTCKIKPKKKWEQKNRATESRAFSRVRTHRNANTSVYRSTESPKRTKQQNRKQQQQQQQRWSTIKRKEREPQSHISPSFPSRRRRFWSSPPPPSLRPIQLQLQLRFLRTNGANVRNCEQNGLVVVTESRRIPRERMRTWEPRKMAENVWVLQKTEECERLGKYILYIWINENWFGQRKTES